MTVSNYFANTGPQPIADLAINEVLEDSINANGGTPVRSGAALLAQDTTPRLLEQALGLVNTIGKGWAANARAVTGVVTVLAASDDGMFINANANAAARLANLPQATALRQGFNFVLRKADAVVADTYTLTPFAGDTISGPTVLNSQFETLLVVRTGATTWATFIVSADLTGNGWANSARAAAGAVTVLAASDDGMFIDQDVTAGSVAANLPQAAALRQGFNLVLRKSDATVNISTLTPFAGDTISGPTVLAGQFDTLLIVRTGATTWSTFVVRSTPAVDVQIFTPTGAGVWTKPTAFTPKAVTVILIGGGGGGGGGAAGTGALVRCGGSGGGGGAYAEKTFAAVDMDATENLVVGAGGTGGAGGAGGGNNDGGVGVSGANTTFGTVVRLTAGGGGGGRFGAASAAAGGGGGGGGTGGVGGVGGTVGGVGGVPGLGSLVAIGGTGAIGGADGSPGGLAENGGGGGGGHTNVPANGTGGGSIKGGGAGGTGAGSTVAPALIAATAGGASSSYAAGGGGAAGASGAAPTVGIAGTAGNSRSSGFGGGGGGGSITAGVAGTVGGAGGVAGGGGGGGGIGEGAGAGGTGGAGGRGLVVVISW